MAMALRMNNNTLYSDYQEIVRQLFHDDKVTWGRCVALYSFTGLVAVNCMHEDQSALVRELTIFLGIYTRERIDPWIRQQKNGWREILSH
jgi:Bcl-2-like 1 (apoptosis regulator Bcl-X)